jgi:OmcA/MtrC family decaheme c-type cytochrome
MSLVVKALMVLASASAITLPTQPSPDSKTIVETARRRPASPSQPAPANRFTNQQIEFFLDDEGIAYIRPGLKIKVNSITIGADRKPVVDVTFTDDLDQPLDRLGKQTPGAISMSFILASYDPATRLYTSYTTRTQTSPATSPKPNVSAVQASADSGGTWTDLERGRSRYTFKTVLPTGFDQSKTHTLGVYSSRNLTALVGKNYYANIEHDFRPDGVAVTEKWDKIRDASSCLNCHDPLAIHGGSRRDVKLCVLCHSPQTTDPDTGNTVDMAVMTHKIHKGHNLVNGYLIVGNANSYNDYSEVTYPQDIRNCDNCHEGTAATKPTQADVYYTKPSRRACGACHETINWETGANHAAGPQLNDTACATCHQPDSGQEFDASIKGAHVIPTKSKQLKGLKVSIVSVADLKPGLKPTVVYKITNNDGTAVDGSKLNAFAPIFAGPTTSYKTYVRESAAARAVFDPATGNTTFTFAAAIPEGASGTWAISGDFYRNVTLKRNDGEADMSVREAAINPQKYVAITGSVTPRRTVVTMAQCNKCHDALALHGGQRLTIEECVICHNPTKGDKDRRPAGNGEEESVSFQRMIHRIHTGHELTQDLTIYGNGNIANNYNEVTYPGDRRNCLSCHVNGTQNVPPAAQDPTITKRDYFSPQGAGTAACLGCHDTQDAAAHAFLNTTNFGGTATAEACGVCHGSGKQWGVDKVHAR